MNEELKNEEMVNEVEQNVNYPVEANYYEPEQGSSKGLGVLVVGGIATLAVGGYMLFKRHKKNKKNKEEVVEGEVINEPVDKKTEEPKENCFDEFKRKTEEIDKQ